MYEKAIINGKVWLDDTFTKSNIYINDEKIIKISDDYLSAKEIIDANNDLVLPGLIDPHVHFDLDLGDIHSRDDFYAGSRQAAYGAISTYIDFLDPVDNPEDLEKAYEKRKKDVEKSYVDYFFHATIKNPQCDLEEFVKKMLSLNIHSLKLFTTYSDSNRRTYDKDIIELLKLSEKYQFLLLAHIEDDDLIYLNKKFNYNDLLKSRPSIAEEKEAVKLAAYVKEYGGYLYMVHLSSGKTLEKLKSSFGDILNKKFFIESCPHYFLFTNNYLEKEDGYLYTLAPPLRTREERKLLRRHFNDIYSIGTDHCAFNKDDKINLPLVEMPLGIGGIEFSFDIMYSLFGKDVINRMSKNITKLYQKLKNQGAILEGNLANLVIYHLEDSVIDSHHGKTDHSLYMGRKRNGYLVHSLLRGNYVIKNGKLLEPFGKEL
ncbi:MAG: dihydropyrimidinase [Tenericutes bacterium]|jgi:dihydropyrimidinase|nr:dihydropyrimidinase [Mycoplasmatota bacterium]